MNFRSRYPMSFLRPLARVLVICLPALIAVMPISVTASWKKIYQNSSNFAFRAVSFVDEKFGVIGGAAQDGVFRTTDGGQVWTQIQLPSDPSGIITEIKMLD